VAQVLDASVAIAWCATNQATPLTTAALKSVLADGAAVPSPFWFEVLYVLTGLMQRRMIRQDDFEIFLDEVSRLDITVDRAFDTDEMIKLHRLAEQYSLTIYDASYLDLALRSGLRLATRDASLASAAERAGAWLYRP
jgi:predicted nucleic acid-binding protein